MDSKTAMDYEDGMLRCFNTNCVKYGLNGCLTGIVSGAIVGGYIGLTLSEDKSSFERGAYSLLGVGLGVLSLAFLGAVSGAIIGDRKDLREESSIERKIKL